MNFSDLESRLNSSVLKHLANASGLCNGVTIPGILKREYIESLTGVGMSGVFPTFKVASGQVPASPRGKQITINDTSYKISEAHPDGSGLTQLVLELA